MVIGTGTKRRLSRDTRYLDPSSPQAVVYFILDQDQRLLEQRWWVSLDATPDVASTPEPSWRPRHARPGGFGVGLAGDCLFEVGAWRHRTDAVRILSRLWSTEEQWWDHMLSQPRGLAWHGEPSPSPQIDTESGAYQSGKKYYEEHETELEQNYAGNFVAIFRDQVVGHGKTFGDVANAAYEAFGYQEMFIQRVGHPDKTARLPSRRIVRNPG